MATPTPDYFVEWATNSDSELTDPGATLRANGWAVGDAPASSHFNYLMHAAAGFTKFLSKANGAEVGWGNTEYSTGHSGGTDPFGQTSDVLMIHYIPSAGRWYIVRVRNTTLELDLFDSSTGNDGEWNSYLDVGSLSVTSYDVTRPVYGNGRVVVGAEDKIFVSTDTTFENLNAGTSPFSQITTIRDLCFDPISGLWVAVGHDGANGKIETSPDLTTWTVRDSRGGDPYRAIDVSPTGNFFATTENAVTNRASSDGINWSVGDTVANSITRVRWNTALDAFLCLDLAQNLYYLKDGTSTLVDTGFNTTTIAETPGFVLVRDPSTTDISALFSIGDYVEYLPLGKNTFVLTPSSLTSEYVGSAAKLIYAYDTDSQRATSWFGAQKENR